jgi:hypothetical protein
LFWRDGRSSISTFALATADSNALRVRVATLSARFDAASMTSSTRVGETVSPTKSEIESAGSARR